MSIIFEGISADNEDEWQHKYKHRMPRSYQIFNDQGRWVGEYRIAYRDSRECWPLPLSNYWALTRIWIDPAFRRQGWLRRTWEKLIFDYPGIQPEPPLSRESWQFFARRPEVDMSPMFLDEGPNVTAAAHAELARRRRRSRTYG